MTIKEKILSFLAREGIKKADFFETVGIVPSNFKGVARQSELGGDKIAKILTLYPRLSAEWLLRDEGDMIRGCISENVHVKSEDHKEATKLEDPIIDRFLGTIKEQAEEIGRLKEKVAQLESATKASPPSP